MNTLMLKVNGKLPGELSFELQRPSGKPLRIKHKTQLSEDELKTKPFKLDQLLPSSFKDEVQKWDDSTPGLLVVESANGQVDGIPWEYLPQVLELPSILVVRLLAVQEPVKSDPLPNAAKLLAAGWSGRPVFALPGIDEELKAIHQLWKDASAQPKKLFEASLDEFANTCNEFRPDILHLIPASIGNYSQGPQLVLSVHGENGSSVSIEQFLSHVPPDLRPRLAMLNTCYGGDGGSGPSPIQIIAERLHTVVVGWLGVIEDATARDFARFFYARILDGQSIIEALRSYCLILPQMQNSELATRDAAREDYRRSYAPVPMVCTPLLEWLSQPLFTHTEAELSTRSRSPMMRSAEASDKKAQFEVATDASPPVLTIVFEPKKWLNPALLKNGLWAIDNLRLISDRLQGNVEIEVSCDTGNGVSTIRQTLELLPKGELPMRNYVEKWQFPVLYDLIGADVPRRQINFSVSCRHEGRLLAQTTTSVLWMGRTEWLDRKDTWHYIPAFVDPYAEGVLDMIGKADEVLRMIANRSSSFTAYQNNDANFVVNQVKAVYNCLRDRPLRYMPPPPIPVHIEEDPFAGGQRIRPPSEVLARGRGTCHDLAILFASFLEQIQIYPLIVLIPKHTFIAFWKDAKAHCEFWEKASKNDKRRPSDPGRLWTITDLKEMQELLQREEVVAVEATKVTDNNLEFSEALRIGYQNLTLETNNQFNPLLQFDVAVDIQASRRKIQPL